MKLKYLGLWMDCKLTWKVHVDYIENKCNEILNLMRCLVGQDYGADKQSMMEIYSIMHYFVLY